jgi:hypothetical protein
MWERLPPGGHRQTLHSGRRPRLGRVGFGEQVESVGTSFGGCPKMSASWGVGRRSEAVQMPQEGGKVRWDRLLKRPPGGGSFHRRRGSVAAGPGPGGVLLLAFHPCTVPSSGGHSGILTFQVPSCAALSVLTAQLEIGPCVALPEPSRLELFPPPSPLLPQIL